MVGGGLVGGGVVEYNIVNVVVYWVRCVMAPYRWLRG